jgi:hypothetical protein
MSIISETRRGIVSVIGFSFGVGGAECIRHDADGVIPTDHRAIVASDVHAGCAADCFIDSVQQVVQSCGCGRPGRDPDPCRQRVG